MVLARLHRPMAAKATVLVAGKSQGVVLAPEDANSLTRRLSAATEGKTAQARFASAQ